MKELDIDLHVGQDFGITYIIENEEITDYDAVMKVRKRPDREVVLELHPTMENNQVTFRISGKETADKHLTGGTYQYDAFLFKKNSYQKIGYGEMNIIPDISLHE